ncbi:hypothetical protein ACHAPX_000061 [Trichoderma viride]
MAEAFVADVLAEQSLEESLSPSLSDDESLPGAELPTDDQSAFEETLNDISLSDASLSHESLNRICTSA